MNCVSQLTIALIDSNNLACDTVVEEASVTVKCTSSVLHASQ